ncbi:hypothetical protein B0H14DRAFT_2583306 [Mycena olivaceomarginata]|nr:hypothetical protein B0H14DRAFT_2583306 [Mycena olivaceomarginata]
MPGLLEPEVLKVRIKRCGGRKRGGRVVDGGVDPETQRYPWDRLVGSCVPWSGSNGNDSSVKRGFRSEEVTKGKAYNPTTTISGVDRGSKGYFLELIPRDWRAVPTDPNRMRNTV